MNSAHEPRPPYQVVLRYCRSFFLMFAVTALPCLVFCYMDVPVLSEYHVYFISGNIVAQVLMVLGSVRHVPALQWLGLGLCLLTAEWIANLSQINSMFETMRSLFFTLTVVSFAPALLYIILSRRDTGRGAAHGNGSAGSSTTTNQAV